MEIIRKSLFFKFMRLETRCLRDEMAEWYKGLDERSEEFCQVSKEDVEISIDCSFLSSEDMMSVYTS